MGLSKQQREFVKILEELGWPRLYVVPAEQFEKIDGESIEGFDGLAADRYPIVTTREGLTHRGLRNTLWHEVGHKLFPTRPHWWIDNFGERMAGGGGRGEWATKYAHSLEDFPSREHLLKFARRAAKKFGAKEST